MIYALFSRDVSQFLIALATVIVTVSTPLILRLLHLTRQETAEIRISVNDRLTAIESRLLTLEKSHPKPASTGD